MVGIKRKAMSKTKSILHAVFDDTTLPDTCAVCRDSLAAYVDAELDGQPAAGLFPAVAAHLAACADCPQEYAELKQLLASARHGQLEQPPVGAVFDFAYLPAAPKTPARQAWRLDELGRLVIQFSADLLRGLQGPAWQPGYLKREAAPAYRYELAGENDDLNVHITAGPAGRDPQVLTVEVDVDIPSRGGWPNLAGSTVTLRRADGSVVEVQETDAFGKVVFEDVPVADLLEVVFEVAVA